MEKTSIDILLPLSKATVTLFEYLSTGEIRQIQKEILKDQKVNLNNDNNNIDLDAINLTSILDQQDQALKYLLKEIRTEDGKIVEDPHKFIYDLKNDDGQLVYSKVTEILSGSKLTSEDKKK